MYKNEQKNMTQDNLKKLEELIAKICPDPEVKHETWKKIDELVNYRFIKKVMDTLPEKNHLEFMELFTENPDNEKEIFGYLEEKGGKGTKQELAEELSHISKELVHDLVSDKEVTKESEEKASEISIR